VVLFDDCRLVGQYYNIMGFGTPDLNGDSGMWAKYSAKGVAKRRCETELPDLALLFARPGEKIWVDGPDCAAGQCCLALGTGF